MRGGKAGALLAATGAAAVLAMSGDGGAAAKRCTVASKKALYETASVQVYRRRRNRIYVDWIACNRRTGRSVVADSDLNDRMGTDDSVGDAAIIEDRYVWTSSFGSITATSSATEPAHAAERPEFHPLTAHLPALSPRAPRQRRSRLSGPTS